MRRCARGTMNVETSKTIKKNGLGELIKEAI